MSKTNVICICPVKNEAWILRHFIEGANAWADYIIIGDHNSTDGSADIARQCDRVKVIPLADPSFDAGKRRKVLLDEARKIPGKSLIIVIDADEMLSANWINSPEWNVMLNAQPGTAFQFEWLYLLPGLEQAITFVIEAAFVDDGTDYFGKVIYEPRIPITHGDRLRMQDIKLLHYVNIDPNRKISKQQWYKCFEIIETGTRPFAACIKYPNKVSLTYGLPVVSIDQRWLVGYDWLDDYRSRDEGAKDLYWWDEEILNYFDNYGTGRFRKVDIWGVDWEKKARLLGRRGDYRDPRSSYEVRVHKLIETYWNQLKMGQASENFLFWVFYKLGRAALRPFGW